MENFRKKKGLLKQYIFQKFVFNSLILKERVFSGND